MSAIDAISVSRRQPGAIEILPAHRAAGWAKTPHEYFLEWRRHFPGLEHSILGVIWDRTIGRGKREAAISIGNLCLWLGASESSVHRAMRRLRAKAAQLPGGEIPVITARGLGGGRGLPPVYAVNQEALEAYVRGGGRALKKGATRDTLSGAERVPESAPAIQDPDINPRQERSGKVEALVGNPSPADAHSPVWPDELKPIREALRPHAQAIGQESAFERDVQLGRMIAQAAQDARPDMAASQATRAAAALIDKTSRRRYGPECPERDRKRWPSKLGFWASVVRAEMAASAPTEPRAASSETDIGSCGAPLVGPPETSSSLRYAGGAGFQPALRRGGLVPIREIAAALLQADGTATAHQQCCEDPEL